MIKRSLYALVLMLSFSLTQLEAQIVNPSQPFSNLVLKAFDRLEKECLEENEPLDPQIQNLKVVVQNTPEIRAFIDQTFVIQDKNLIICVSSIKEALEVTFQDLEETLRCKFDRQKIYADLCNQLEEDTDLDITTKQAFETTLHYLFLEPYTGEELYQTIDISFLFEDPSFLELYNSEI